MSEIPFFFPHSTSHRHAPMRLRKCSEMIDRSTPHPAARIPILVICPASGHAGASANARNRRPVGASLWGVPFAFRTTFDRPGHAAPAACAEYAYIPDRPTVVRGLKAAGALVVVQDHFDQFATGLVACARHTHPRNASDATWCRAAPRRCLAVATARGRSSPSRWAPTRLAPPHPRRPLTTSSG